MGRLWTSVYGQLSYGTISPVDILSQLNPQQRQAVTAEPGPVLVLAGPGSGKTRVLTHRIAYVIKDLGVRPHKILAVTFTNKAAREMESRVQKLLDEDLKGIWLGTFHAVCARILRREAGHLPFSGEFVIFDEDDQLFLIKRVLEELNLDDKTFRPRSVLSAISSAKNELIFPDSYTAAMEKKPGRDPKKFAQFDKRVLEIYKRYGELLIENNAVDFDDLLVWTYLLLKENKEKVLDKYARLFEYIMVDEFQDTNLVQYQLLLMLSSVYKNIFVVGDEDQSIYRWRGADYRNILRFEEDFPKAQKILLEQNYRSTQNILDAAVSVINRNVFRTQKRLKATPELGKGDTIVIAETEDDYQEAQFVVETIQRHIKFGNSASDMAVMYRTNAQSRILEEAFLHAGLPYKLVGAQKFYGRKEIKDLIAYLRLIFNLKDQVSLERIINVPPRKIGDKTLGKLLQLTQDESKSIEEILTDLGQYGKESKYASTFSKSSSQLFGFCSLVSELHSKVENLPLSELVDHVLREVGYYDYLIDTFDDASSRWENILELRRLALEHDEANLNLARFLERLALVSDQDTILENQEAPTLLTLHAAKGLEFPIVFIIGLDEGILPHSRAIKQDQPDPEELAEERRLFYVGITRAKQVLYLVRAETRKLYGEFLECEPSGFLKDIPEELIGSGSHRLTRGYSARLDRKSDWESSGYGRKRKKVLEETNIVETTHRRPITHVVDVEQHFKPNMVVRHSLYGEGIVKESRIENGDETVVINFNDQNIGQKAFVASLAKLEKVSSEEKEQ